MSEQSTRVADIAASASAPAAPPSNALRRIGNLTLRSRLLLMLIPASLLSMGTVAYLGYTSGRDALTQLATDQIVAVRSAKKQQIETYFRTMRDTFVVFGENVAVVSALSQFRDGFSRLGRSRLAEERRRLLEDEYRMRFMPLLQKRSGSNAVLFEALFPRTDRALEAQTLFLAENPNPLGERERLVDHPVSNPYTLAHFTYHPWFRDLAKRLNLYDLLLVDAENGDVVYSVAKEIEFGTSLLDGPHANTNAGRLFRQTLAEHRKGYVKLVDVERYVPSAGLPAMFIATPVYANFKLIGVLIGQLSTDALNRATNGDRSWNQDGLGATGLAYIAGPAADLRTDHRWFLEEPEVFLAALRARGVSEPAVAAVKSTGSTILTVTANVEGVRRALRGETGTVRAASLRSQDALQAYTPLSIPDLTWVLLTQIEKSEILAPQIEFQRNIMILACSLALLTTLAGMWFASRFLRPVHSLTGAVEQLERGESTAIDASGSDEFGQLTRSFKSMSERIAERDRSIAERTRAHDALLRRIVPPNVVDRLKAGEAEIVEEIPNVTLIFASQVGFVPANEAMSAVESMRLLSDLFDAADTLAEQKGIDRIRTFGEHYIAAVGLSVPRLDHAHRAVEFADALAAEWGRLAHERGLPLRLRVALASGDIRLGLIGANRFTWDVWGRTLNTVRRLVHEAGENELRIAASTYELLGNKDTFVQKANISTASIGSLTSYARLFPSARMTLQTAAE